MLCLAPSRDLQSRPTWDREHMVEQCRALQLLETCQLMTSGLPHRLKPQTFLARYGGLLGLQGAQPGELVAALQGVWQREGGGQRLEEVVMGPRHVFLSEGARQDLEERRKGVKRGAAVRLQRWWRRRRKERGAGQMRLVLETLRLHRLDMVRLLHLQDVPGLLKGVTNLVLPSTILLQCLPAAPTRWSGTGRSPSPRGGGYSSPTEVANPLSLELPLTCLCRRLWPLFQPWGGGGGSGSLPEVHSYWITVLLTSMFPKHLLFPVFLIILIILKLLMLLMFLNLSVSLTPVSRPAHVIVETPAGGSLHLPYHYLSPGTGV